MRDLSELDVFRLTSPELLRFYGWSGDSTCGAFVIPSPVDRKPLHVIAAADLGWDHVSVSRPNRTPTWGEMEHIKRLFFRDDEAAMQLHVPVAQHISLHPNVLHIWRPHGHPPIPLPPPLMVAPVGLVS